MLPTLPDYQPNLQLKDKQTISNIVPDNCPMICFPNGLQALPVTGDNAIWPGTGCVQLLGSHGHA